MLQPRPAVLGGLLALCVAMRLTPWVLFHFGLSIDPETTIYPWNFSPFLAVSLFGGAHLAHRRWSYAVPLGAFLLGDLVIWALSGRLDWAFYPGQVFVYGSVALTVTLGFMLRKRRSALAIGATGLLSACLFYVITNFGVWAVGDGIRYPHTIAGLIDCYVQAIPFFRNSLMAMALFCPLLFSSLALRRMETELQPVRVVAFR